jgi:hypothetical protein
VGSISKLISDDAADAGRRAHGMLPELALELACIKQKLAGQCWCGFLH